MHNYACKNKIIKIIVTVAYTFEINYFLEIFLQNFYLTI